MESNLECRHCKRKMKDAKKGDLWASVREKNTKVSYFVCGKCVETEYTDITENQLPN